MTATHTTSTKIPRTAPDHSFPDFRDGRFDGFMREARRLYKLLLQTLAP